MAVITKKKLGEILLEEKLITEEQLAKSLAEQGSGGKLKLGQHLIRRGIISEDQIVDCLGRQLRIRKYHPDMYTFDVKLSQLITIDDAQKYRLAPLNREGRLLTVAMTDPMDIAAIDFIELKANCEVEVVICAEREFNQLISGLYGIQSGIGGVLGVLDIDDKIVTEKEDDAAQDIQLAYLQDMAGEAPVIRIVNSIFLQAIREGASDIHISPQQNTIQMRFRIDGKLHEVAAPSKAMFLPIIARIKILANMDITITRIPQDGRFTLRMENKEINVRASSIPTIYGENLVLRLLDTSSGIYSLDHIGFSREDTEKIRTIINKPYGMILSTGPTGSGKSTSIYSILNELNSADSSIMTLEDPVEYRIQNIRQVQLNIKAGMTFASGLRSILRQDPDIIMVGEIRDAETAAIAVQAAQTGHRVLSTLHTN
ncbi:MAG: ATPase, T2SS/T4P/T4SS family, partial [Desulfobacterales bacterium]|nr:ATPase, T2SS/T4P/T4SS family [Desulfobacterales bacterium]